jgi:hypothetical protein
VADDRETPRRRWPLVTLVTLGILGSAAVFVRNVVLRDHARIFTVDDSLERYRSQTTMPVSIVPATTDAAPELPVELPATGVYRYRTSGEESVDALGGTRHVYPDLTTITVVADGCGVLLRWDALVERREEWRLCTTDQGVELQTAGLKHQEFFGQALTEDITCDRTVLLVPADRSTTPDPVVQDCRLGADPWSPTWKVLGWDTRLVDDVTVDVVVARMTVTDDHPDYWEQTSIDWDLAANGLPVAADARRRSRSPSPIGGVTYDERFTLELVALTPLR